MNSLTAALVAMRRSPYQTLAAIMMVSVTFFVGYAFSLLLLGANQILQYFETRPQVIAFFQLKTDPAMIEQLSTRLKEQPFVESTEVVSPERALQMYQEDNKDDPLLLELVTADILPASLEVSGHTVTDLPKIKEVLDQQSIVDEVIFQQDVIESLTRWTSALRIVGISSIVILSITSLLIVFIIISMKVISKKQAIHIMRIIGATRWYISWPFAIEGILYGLMGSVVGWLTMYAVLLYATPWLKSFLGSITLLPIPWPVLALQVSLGSLIGMCLGTITGLLAVRRVIKR